MARITEVNAVNIWQNPGRMLNQARHRHDSIVIDKGGKPVGALTDRIARYYADVPMEEGLAEINATVARERRD